MRRPLAGFVGVLLAVAGCSAGGGQPAHSARGLPLGQLRITSGDETTVTLEVEIAETPEATAAGLMAVERLRDDQGMVFLQPGPSTVPFWMKDTLIPLDIAFWDEEGRIFDIQQMQPCTVPAADCPRHHPSGPYVGALEVNLGLLERSGVRTGDTVALERR